MEQELLLETGTTQIPKYVAAMLEEEGTPDEVLTNKLEEHIDRMFQEQLIDTAERLAMKENLVHNASAYCIKLYCISPSPPPAAVPNPQDNKTHHVCR